MQKLAGTSRNQPLTEQFTFPSYVISKVFENQEDMVMPLWTSVIDGNDTFSFPPGSFSMHAMQECNHLGKVNMYILYILYLYYIICYIILCYILYYIILYIIYYILYYIIYYIIYYIYV